MSSPTKKREQTSSSSLFGSQFKRKSSSMSTVDTQQSSTVPPYLFTNVSYSDVTLPTAKRKNGLRSVYNPSNPLVDSPMYQQLGKFIRDNPADVFTDVEGREYISSNVCFPSPEKLKETTGSQKWDGRYYFQLIKGRHQPIPSISDRLTFTNGTPDIPKSSLVFADGSTLLQQNTVMGNNGQIRQGDKNIVVGRNLLVVDETYFIPHRATGWVKFRRI